MKTAPELLKRAAEIMEERGKQYDKSGGERSMSKTVQIFNIFTDREQFPLSEQDGWLLMQILKDVRQQQTPGKPHIDSLEDCIAYSALKAEAFLRAEPTIEFTVNESTADEIFTDKAGAIVPPGYPKIIDDDGWIDWNGGECPVHKDTIVEIQTRDGELCARTKASDRTWSHDNHPNRNLVRYRIHKEAV